MGSRNRLRGAVGAAFATVAVAATLAGAQPASAAPAYYSVGEYDNCNSGYTCLWYSNAKQGAGVGFYNDAWNFATIPSSYTFINNQSGSGQNRTSGSNVTKLYNTAGGSGTARCLRAGQYDSDFQNDSFYHVASALVWASSCGSVTVFR
ncbi:hypothetical protein [Actinoplanes sp. GCM10030250]|uniref:hypothetical protein n=1 Tax=Actinoplanes sp. GCM10030250 TaxID=3273376 RepID=UPI0036189E80